MFTIEIIPTELSFHFSIGTKKIFLGVKNPIVYGLFTIESDSTTILSISLLVRKIFFLPQKALPFYKIFTIGMILVMFSSHFSVVTQKNFFGDKKHKIFILSHFSIGMKKIFLHKKILPFYKLFTIEMILVMFFSHFPVVTQKNIFAPEISMFFQKLLLIFDTPSLIPRKTAF